MNLEKLDIDIEIPCSPTVLRRIGKEYRRKPAADYSDLAASLTHRQSLFYRNLIQIASHLKRNELPVDFETRDQGSFFLDRGCVKIAVHAGFLCPLENDAQGEVSKVTLAWDATGTRKV